mgnify:CR=1 FL=1
MNRITSAYKHEFGRLMKTVRASRAQKGIQALFDRARKIAASEHLAPPLALHRVHVWLIGRLQRWRHRAGAFHFPQTLGSPEFWCDAGLGGLARWVRLAGYEAHWQYGIDDAELVGKAQAGGAILLTIDSMLMERRVLREGVVPSFWVPPTLSLREQLELVFLEFQLPLRTSRCSACGGHLSLINKEEWQRQIPPKTYRWLNEFYLCDRCGKLFWKGTHWQKARNVLAECAGSSPRPG